MTAKVKDNIEKFEEYKQIQGKIDNCDGLISRLKVALRPKKGDLEFSMRSSWPYIEENLGEYLTSAIGKDIILLIEAEKVKLLARQEKIEIEGC